MALGIRKTVKKMIEIRGIQPDSFWTVHKEKSMRIAQAVRNFTKQNESVKKENLSIS